MEQILFNLALMHVTNFCKDNNINCSDTYLTKRQRQFAYDLKQFAAPNKVLASVTFHKNQVPTFCFNKEI